MYPMFSAYQSAKTAPTSSRFARPASRAPPAATAGRGFVLGARSAVFVGAHARLRGASMDEATLKAARSKTVRCCMAVERRVANASDAFKQASFCESASELHR